MGTLMTNLDSKSTKVGDLFSQDFFFEIPNYQRPFSWEEDQLSDLVDDLVSADRSSDYFLGTLVLHEVEGRTFAVVDGQQRLTALSILLACLRDLLEDTQTANELQQMLVQPERKLQGISARSRLTVRDSTPFEAIVSTREGTQSLKPADVSTTSVELRYREAVSTFRKVLTPRGQDDLLSLASFITQHVVVIFLAASTFDDAFRLFTVVNDRGMQLRRIDVLKADNLSPDVIKDDNKREEYARKWEDLEETLGAANFESLFHAMRLIYVQEKPESDLLYEFQKRIYGKPNRPTAGTAFIDTLVEYVALYESLFLTRDYLTGSGEEAKYKTLVYSMVKEFRASEWRACVLAYAKKFGKTGVFQFILEIEKIYVAHWVIGMRKDERYASYTEILKSIETSKNGDDVSGKIKVDIAPVQAACRRANFYGAGFAKYLLTRAEIQATDLDAPRQFDPKSVEHVLPQKPKSGSQWFKDFTTLEREELVHSVGNLVLLSKAKNSSAQNKDFADKKVSYLQPKVSDYPRSLSVVGEVKWTPDTIRERTNYFANSVLAAL
jgi:hypothetical protein